MTTSHKLCIVLCIKFLFFLCVSSPSLLLSVNINPKLIRKVQLSNHPETVEQLFIEVRETLELEGDFSVQYEFPDFENALCNLTDMAMPAEKAVLHIVWNSGDEPRTPSITSQTSQASVSALDTASISSPASSHRTSIIQTILRSAAE